MDDHRAILRGDPGESRGGYGERGERAGDRVMRLTQSRGANVRIGWKADIAPRVALDRLNFRSLV